jgi:hypothetical protein
MDMLVSVCFVYLSGFENRNNVFFGVCSVGFWRFVKGEERVGWCVFSVFGWFRERK